MKYRSSIDRPTLVIFICHITVTYAEKFLQCQWKDRVPDVMPYITRAGGDKEGLFTPLCPRYIKM